MHMGGTVDMIINKISPVSETVNVQKDKQQQSHLIGGLSFLDLVQRASKSTVKEKEEPKEEKHVDQSSNPAVTIQQNYWMMQYLLDSSKRKEEKK